MQKSGLSIFSVITLLVISLTHVFSQEKLGIANSNYSSTNSIFLNPSSSVDSRTFIQMNLIGANAYLITNSAYLPDFSIWRAASGYHEKPFLVTNNRKKFFYGNFSLEGPAVVLSHRRIGIGFFVRGRAEIDIRRIPYQLTNILLPLIKDSVIPTAADFDLRNIKISNMSWTEYGLNFGAMIKKRNGLLITAGGNIKYLTGINLLYANLDRINAYMKDTLIDIKKLKGEVRIAEPDWGGTGNGIGMDLGITYRRALKSETEYEGYYVNSKKSNCQHIDYLYKIGLSLLDIGYINFKTRTYKAGIDGSFYIPNYNNSESFPSLIQYELEIPVERNSPIMASLPTGLSAQLDINMSHHFYLNGTIVKNILPASSIGVQRANLISITPRYERRQVEVAMPLTLHRFIYPQLGFAFRFRSFVLGTDNIFPFVIANNTYGLNLYFNLGISLFKNPACRVKHHRQKKEKTKKRSTADCPKFEKRKFLRLF